MKLLGTCTTYMCINHYTIMYVYTFNERMTLNFVNCVNVKSNYKTVVSTVTDIKTVHLLHARIFIYTELQGKCKVTKYLIRRRQDFLDEKDRKVQYIISLTRTKKRVKVMQARNVTS